MPSSSAGSKSLSLILLKSGAWNGSGLGSLKMSPGAAKADVLNNKGSTQAENLARIADPLENARKPHPMTRAIQETVVKGK
jgi:hypothetical protein